MGVTARYHVSDKCGCCCHRIECSESRNCIATVKDARDACGGRYDQRCPRLPLLSAPGRGLL